jgi:hypothetical protein
MPGKEPLIRVAVGVALVSVLLGVGGARGVGPLAHVTPADQVKDPKEMIARSFQAVLDANSVHLEARLDGHGPGALFGRADASVVVDGTRASVDARPQDARTRAHLASPAFGITLDTVTVWDSVYSRSSAADPWTKGSAGAAAATAGLDANPLTLVDRLRAWLDTTGMAAPTVKDVACAAPSGICREIHLDAGTEPARILVALHPGGQTDIGGPARTTLTLLADAATLRPVHVELAIQGSDGTLSLLLVVDASAWDQPSVIDEPSAG